MTRRVESHPAIFSVVPAYTRDEMADQTDSDDEAETGAAREESDVRETERGTDARQDATEADDEDAEEAEDEAVAEAERAREEAIPDDEPEPDTEGDTHGDAREQDNPDAHRDEPPYSS